VGSSISLQIIDEVDLNVEIKFEFFYKFKEVN
jgi:hypothetical protein